MSNTGRSRITRIKFFESNIRSAKLTSRGRTLQGLEKEVAVQILTAIWIVWNQLSRVDGTPEPLETLFSRWLNVIGRIDIEAVLTTLKTAADTFDGILSRGELYDWPWQRFKRAVKIQDPLVDIGVIHPLRGLYASCVSGNGDTASIRAVRQAFGLMGKTAFSAKDPELTDSALRTFVMTDRSVTNHGASKFITGWFRRNVNVPRSQLSENHFRHGNGRTKEVTRKYVSYVPFKYDLLRSDPLLRNAIRELGLSFDLPPGEIRVALVAVVPKKATSYRTIVFETTTLQWWQQGVSAWLWEWMNHHPYLRRRIDQEGNGVRNRKLAQEGSIRGDYATIDLSSASDLVSYQFVLTALRLCPDLRIAWEASRSLRAELTYSDGQKEQIELRKSAGMGSSLTFPVETLGFCSIVEEAITMSGGDPTRSRYVVHGDDIVVETTYAPAVIRRLEYYGFQVNLEKSFYKKQLCWNFRESCGGFYLDGDPIDILRFPRRVSAWVGIEKPWPSQLISIVNDAFMYGLDDLRQYGIWKLKQLPKKLQPLFSTNIEDSSCIYSPWATNFHLIRKKGSRAEVPYYHGTITTVYRKAPNESLDHYRVYEWLRLASWRPEWDEYDVETLEEFIELPEGYQPQARWRVQKPF